MLQTPELIIERKAMDLILLSSRRRMSSPKNNMFLSTKGEVCAKSDFGVTGKLLAETLVLDGTGNYDESHRLIRLKVRWSVGLKTFKTWHAFVVLMSGVL